MEPTEEVVSVWVVFLVSKGPRSNEGHEKHLKELCFDRNLWLKNDHCSSFIQHALYGWGISQIGQKRLKNRIHAGIESQFKVTAYLSLYGSLLVKSEQKTGHEETHYAPNLDFKAICYDLHLWLTKLHSY